MAMPKLELWVLKAECYRGNPRTRHHIVSNIKDWILGDIEATFDYAIKHGYMESRRRTRTKHFTDAYKKTPKIR